MENMENIFYDYNLGKKIEKIGYIEEHNDNTFRRKICVYDIESDIPLHPYIIRIEDAKLFAKSEEHITICLSIKNKQLLDFINNLDNIIDKEIIKNTGIPSLKIVNMIPMMTISVNCNPSIFDIKGNNIRVKDISLKSDIKLVMELGNIYIRDNSGIKCWKVIQMQEKKNIDITKSLFQEFPKTNNVKPFITQMSFIPPPPLINMHVPIVAEKKQVNPVKLSLTMEELLNAKNKLKKKNIPNMQNIPNIPNIPNIQNIGESHGGQNNDEDKVHNLKKVITRVPLSGVELMKKEQFLKNYIEEMAKVEFEKDMSTYKRFLHKAEKKFKKYEKIFSTKTPTNIQ